MQISIKYFGQLTEITNTEEESIEFNGTYIYELLDELYKKYNTLVTKDFKVAQNQEFVSNDDELTGKEIALLPPFSGG